MTVFYVDKRAQANGAHAVHRHVGCPHPVAPGNRYYLGTYEHCSAAVARARRDFPTAKGCSHCAPDRGGR